MARKTAARLGQHFLTNDYYAKVLAEAVAVRSGERIVEIGPGKGALTKHLLATGAPVLAIEKDEALAAQLPAVFADASLVVHAGDIRDFIPPQEPYVVAANIPYYITGEIIRQFLTAKHQPRAIALLIQKEVAERIVARDKKESILSLSVKAFGTPRIITRVGKGNFNPPPSVDSAIILIENISHTSFAQVSEELFFDVVHAGFAAKRKILSGNLAKKFDAGRVHRAFTENALDAKVRAEDVPLATWLKLAQALS